MAERSYEIARRGLATNFTESEVPLDYALAFRNRFINAAGGAEKRPGIVAVTAKTPTRGIITGLHEFVASDDTSTQFASSDGQIFRYDGSSAWTQVYAFATAARVRAVQFDDKLVFWNGYEPQIYINAVSATPARLLALMEEGTCGASTSASAVTDADVTNWIAATFVTVGDVVFNVKRGTYGIVTAVTSSSVSHTPMSAAAIGFGNTTTPVSGVGIGGEPTLGDAYRILDQIELNVLADNGLSDNVGTVTAVSGGVTETFIAVSADRVPDWTKTQARPGDIVQNTTRNNGSFISRIVSSGLYVSPVLSNAIVGDSLVFTKSAMPIASWIHIHYGRAWMIDARDPRNVIASGANDIQDFTVDSSSLDSVTLRVGAQLPGADPAKALATFQTYLIVGTERAVIAFSGTTPSSLTPAALFPQGIVSPDSFVNTGNDLAFISPDGLLSMSLLVNTNNLQRSNLSEPIKNTLRAIIREISDTAVDNGQIQALNYQRRSWIIVKLASKLYIYNYANFVLDDGRIAAGASWSDFDGFIGAQRVMFVSHESDLLLGGADGTMYQFDQGTYTDAGVLFDTEYTPGWLHLEEPKKSTKIKSGSFIVPNYEVGGAVVYTIEATGDYDLLSLDTAIVTAESDDGGRPIGTWIIGRDMIGMGRTVGQKTPLRWRGENFRLTFKTKDAIGPDVLAGFAIYGQIHGRR